MIERFLHRVWWLPFVAVALFLIGTALWVNRPSAHTPPVSTQAGCGSTDPAKCGCAPADNKGYWDDLAATGTVVLGVSDGYPNGEGERHHLTLPRSLGIWELRCEVDTAYEGLTSIHRQLFGGDPLYRRTIDTTCVWSRHECELVDSVGWLQPTTATLEYRVR